MSKERVFFFNHHDYRGGCRRREESDPTLSTVVGISPTTGADGKKSDPILSATKVFCTSVGADGRGVFPTFF